MTNNRRHFGYTEKEPSFVEKGMGRLASPTGPGANAFVKLTKGRARLRPSRGTGVARSSRDHHRFACDCCSAFLVFCIRVRQGEATCQAGA